jgi:sigma-E factor negative regulatory protein RseC
VDESAEKIVEVEDVVASQYEVGDIVEVALQSGDMGTKAVVLTYIVPFFVLAVLLFGSVMLGVSEGLSAVVSLAGVVGYYLVIYALRDRIKKKIKFIILK